MHIDSDYGLLLVVPCLAEGLDLYIDRFFFFVFVFYIDVIFHAHMQVSQQTSIYV